ncbi:hypothetical protein H5410_061083, partial [Solanum commersonii]
MEADFQCHLAEERDRNTKFFHKTANGYKRCNNIYYLLIQDELISDPLRINDEMLDFYKKIYTETLEGGISHLPLLDPSMRAAPLAPSEWRKRLEAVNNTNNSSHGNFNPSFILLDVRN